MISSETYLRSDFMCAYMFCPYLSGIVQLRLEVVQLALGSFLLAYCLILSLALFFQCGLEGIQLTLMVLPIIETALSPHALMPLNI